MWNRTLAPLAALGTTLALAGCAGLGGDDLAGSGYGDDPWGQTRVASSSVVLPVTQTGAGIAVIRQALARAKAAEAAEAAAAPGSRRLSEATLDAQPVWHPTGRGADAMPARHGDDDRRSGRGVAPQRANG